MANPRSISVTREFTFDAAHHLENYRGKCEALHGHTWKVLVTVTGKIGSDGIVVDFVEMKKIIDEKVRSRLDHSCLNDTLHQPTAENIGLWIYDALAEDLPGISEVRVYESPSSFATLSFNA